MVITIHIYTYIYGQYSSTKTGGGENENYKQKKGFYATTVCSYNFYDKLFGIRLIGVLLGKKLSKPRFQRKNRYGRTLQL